jgi:putative flippase GtrA
MNPVFLKKATRFAFTGIFVTGIHTIIAILFVNYFNSNPPLANGIAFIGATLASYTINTVWSFSTRMHGRILFKFTIVSIVGFVLAMLVARIVQGLGFSYLLGICAVALSIPPVTFMLHNFWTYR